MQKQFLLFAILFSVSAAVWAQELELNCTQTLRTARSTYDQGRLHEIPPLLEKCLTTGFSDAERIEALKILVQTYIYLEEPDKADEAMLSLLQTEHFFEPNEQVDPIEFRSLYKKFRTNPIWRAGIKVGVLSNQFVVLENHYVWSAAQGQGSYASQVGIQFGGVFEKDFKNLFVLAPEVMFSSYTFEYSNGSLLTEDQAGGAPSQQLLNTIAQQRLNLNLLVQYKLGKQKGLTDTFIPYVALGPSVNYLMSSSSTLTTNVTELVTGPARGLLTRCLGCTQTTQDSNVERPLR